MSESDEFEETHIISDDSTPGEVVHESAEFVVNDSDSESEEEVIVRPKGRRPAAIEDSDSQESKSDGSDNDDDDDEEDERALSPRTRMSITGIRPSDLTDDSSSEIEHSSEESADEESGSEEDELTKHNSLLQMSATEKATVQKLKIPLSKDQVISSPTSARYSTIFASGIKDKLSSTIFPIEEPEKQKSTINSSDSDIEVMSLKNNTIEIFSSDDESFKTSIEKEPVEQPKSRISETKRQSRSINKSDAVDTKPSIVSTQAPALVQPKIKSSAQPKASTSITHVSGEFYNSQLRKYEEIKAQLLTSDRVLKQCAQNLPDNGRQLQLSIDNIRKELKAKAEYIATLRLRSRPSSPLSAPKPLAEKKPFFNSIKPPDWNELSAAVNQIQPTHTGKQGMATFNNQRALTIERLKDLHGSLENCPAANVLAEEPEGIVVKLMNHQRHALAWMEWRENQKPRGGILADDMGLGKTLTTIAMILAHKQRAKNEPNDPQSSSEDEETKENYGWSSKGRRTVHNGGTLVICPASLMRQWESEVKTKLVRNKLSVCVHHGNNRETKGKNLCNFDIVVTTYQIVSREHKSLTAIFGVKWERIILDEAHIVRNHKAQSSLAVCDLRAKSRWCLTGTPIQNKELDVFALLKFLRCSPFDDLAHWKRWIDNKSAGGQQRLNTVMKTLMLRRTKLLLQESGELRCLPEKMTTLIEVALDNDEMNVYQKVMIISRSLFAQYLMQHAERQTEMGYRGVSRMPTEMQNKDPNGAYYKIHKKFAQMHSTKEVKSHEILLLLLRLRQICCHPGLIHAMLEEEDAANLNNSDSYDEPPEINLLEQLKKLAITDENTNSSNLLNDNDGEEVVRTADEEYIAKASARILYRTNPVFSSERASTKMKKVMETIQEHVLPKNDKAIIVSQWTSYLDILQQHLIKNNIKTLALNGKIPVKNRQDIVDEFNKENGNKRVLLLSLTAGGVGLNLVGANHLLLIDLHWNPQLEAQAQDRIYRVGQKKNVIIYKFMCTNTVEERIKALQDRKLEIANAVLTGVKSSAGSKLTIDELRGLFDM